MPAAHIFQINLSQGGVPKLAVPTAEITTEGLTDDLQQDRKHHGGPDRAVCLYSLERILVLQEEGHPVFPGATGENLTLTGVDWDAMQPGARLRLGSDAVLEIVSFTAPCATIKPFFIDGEVVRISQKQHPGWSRVYARVITGGEVKVGMPVDLLS
ncbi:MAG: MOSC domain-containing protein [bacterium]|nr:MOSC domain-containing protein [bacterium]